MASGTRQERSAGGAELDQRFKKFSQFETCCQQMMLANRQWFSREANRELPCGSCRIKHEKEAPICAVLEAVRTFFLPSTSKNLGQILPARRAQIKHKGANWASANTWADSWKHSSRDSFFTSPVVPQRDSGTARTPVGATVLRGES